MSETNAYEFVISLDAPGAGNWQGTCRNAATGEWFIAHSRGSFVGGSPEDVLIYRFTPGGKYRDKMICVDAGHVYGFGVSDTNILWLTWNGPDGNDVVTVDYRPGKTVRKSAASQMHVFTDCDAQVSFSPSREGLVVMELLGDRFAFTKRLKADVLANIDDQHGKTITRPKSAGMLQGFSVVGPSLLLLYGAPEKRAWIERWSFETGEKLGSLDVTAAGREVGPLQQREPEGMDGRLFSVKIQGGTARRMRVYRLTDAFC